MKRSIAGFAAIASICTGLASAQAPLPLPTPLDHIDVAAREPMVAELPDGTLFVAGYGDPGPKLWKSTDRGATWSRVHVGTEADGAIGNSDVDLAVASDGTLYFAQMGFDRKVGEGTHISVGVSRDAGATWRWTMVSKTRFDDRPWIAVSADGTAHLIWNDGSGVCYATSADRGGHWTGCRRIAAAGGSSHLAVGPKREIAVRVVPPSASGKKSDSAADLLVVSIDGGKTWRTRAAPGHREWAPEAPGTLPRWVEPLAWNARGALFSLWTERNGLWLARSLDAGATWRTWHLIESRALMFYPYVVARGNGELAASWFSGGGDSLRAQVAHIALRDTVPALAVSPPIAAEVWGWSARKEDPTLRDTGGEYLALLFLRDGSLGLVAPIQDERQNRFGFSWWRIGLR
jgi:hypothetical protein